MMGSDYFLWVPLFIMVAWFIPASWGYIKLSDADTLCIMGHVFYLDAIGLYSLVSRGVTSSSSIFKLANVSSRFSF